MTLAYWEIEEGATLPQHAHEHEQVTNLIRGSFRLTIDGMESTLSPGQVAVIPSGVSHAGIALTACEIIDVFYPVREDYRETS
jgi:quercetin dioxygenase-like cupin family protein